MQGINKCNSQDLCKTGMEMSEEGDWKGNVLASLLQQQYRKVCFHLEMPCPCSDNQKAATVLQELGKKILQKSLRNSDLLLES